VFVPRAPSVTASRATSLPEGGSIMPLSNRKQTDKSKFEIRTFYGKYSIQKINFNMNF
jgi:hypothetical protein